MSELNEETNVAQGSPMTIVPVNLEGMKRKCKTALDPNSQLEKILRHSLTPQPPGYDMRKESGTPKVSLLSCELTDFTDWERFTPEYTAYVCISSEDRRKCPSTLIKF